LPLGSIFLREKNTTSPKQVPYVTRKVLWGKRQNPNETMNFPKERPKFLEEKHTFSTWGKAQVP